MPVDSDHEKSFQMGARERLATSVVQVIFKILFNISNWRKRGVASNPLLIIPGFFLHFSLEPSYGYFRFEGNGKIPLGR